MSACLHGMPSPASCVDCMNDGNLPPAPQPERPSVEAFFDARFDGQCGGCNLGIHVGERIARLSNESYQHASCARDGGLA